MNIGELPYSTNHLESDVRADAASGEFRENPDIPGLLVLEEDRVVGVLSRTAFEQELSRPFAKEALGQRPVSLLVDAIGADPLVVEEHLTLAEVAECVVERAPSSVFDPFVVATEDGSHRLVDVRVLVERMADELRASTSPSRTTSVAVPVVDAVPPTESSSSADVPTEVAPAEPLDDLLEVGTSMAAEPDSAAFDGVVCIRTALERVGGDQDMLKQIAAMVVDQTQQWMAEMEQLLDAENFPELRRLAHTLKSSADTFGATATVEAAFELEGHAASGDRESSRAAFERLSDEFLRFVPAVARLAETPV